MKLAQVTTRLTPARWGGLIAVLAVVLLALFRPWVTTPLDDQGKAIVGPQAFDAATFVGKAWSEQLPGKLDAAAPVGQAASTPAFLKGEGLVMKVDTTSRVGFALVDLDPPDGEADVALALGPVITGSDLRDALGLAFADFDTQVDYANVGSDLNRRALAGLPLLSDPSALEGKRIAFVGAGARTAGGEVRITPVRLTLLP